MLAGTGHISKRHARAIAATPGCRLVRVLSRDRRRAEEIALPLGARAGSDPDEALADPEVGAISICTEHDRHEELMLRAARHRRHALVEKPLAIDPEAAGRTLSACEAAGIVTACVFQRRFDPPLAALRRDFRAGLLGAPLGVELSLPWRREPSYFAAAPWRGDAARAGGGVLMMQAIHLLDAARFVLGEVVEVCGLVRTARAESAVEDLAAVLLRFENGALGAAFATTVAARELPARAALHFAQGSHVLEDAVAEAGPAARPRVFAALRRLLGRSGPGPQADRGRASRGSFRDVYSDFREAVFTGRPPRSSGRDALATVALVQAVYCAARTGETVHLGPAARGERG